jgi:hypothetical protein
MALGGFLAGLAESSSKWPGAIQQRMLFQQKTEERQDLAERRAEETARAQQNAIIARLGITAEAGSVDATEQFGQNLSPENAPLLSSFMGIAERSRKDLNHQEDQQRFEFSQRKLDAERKEFTEWQRNTDGTFWRENMETREVEFREGEPPKPKKAEVFLEAGKILMSDGTTIDIDPELVQWFGENGSLMNPVHAYDKEGGVIIFKNGDVLPLPPETQKYIDTRLKWRQDLEFQGFIDEEGYRFQNKIDYLYIQTGLTRESNELNYRRENLKNQHRFTSGLYKTAISSLENNRSTPEEILTNVGQAMVGYNIPPEEIDRLLETWKPAFNQYKYNYKIGPSAQKELGVGRAIQISAEKIHQLLKDPEVQRRIGQVTGQVTDFKMKIRGGKGVPQSYITFQFELDNLVDTVKRARTGAAAKGSEDTFYSDLLGSNTREWKFLQGKMAAVIGHENRKAFARHSVAWQIARNKEMSPEEEAQMRRDLLFDSDVIVSIAEVSDEDLQDLVPH